MIEMHSLSMLFFLIVLILVATLLWSDLRTILTPIYNIKHPRNIRSNSFLTFLTQFLDVDPCNLCNVACCGNNGETLSRLMMSCAYSPTNLVTTLVSEEVNLIFILATLSLVRFPDDFSQFSLSVILFFPAVLHTKVQEITIFRADLDLSMDSLRISKTY